jgi:hypothetical protein
VRGDGAEGGLDIVYKCPLDLPLANLLGADFKTLDKSDVQPQETGFIFDAECVRKAKVVERLGIGWNSVFTDSESEVVGCVYVPSRVALEYVLRPISPLAMR